MPENHDNSSSSGAPETYAEKQLREKREKSSRFMRYLIWIWIIIILLAFIGVAYLLSTQLEDATPMNITVLGKSFREETRQVSVRDSTVRDGMVSHIEVYYFINTTLDGSENVSVVSVPKEVWDVLEVGATVTLNCSVGPLLGWYCSG